MKIAIVGTRGIPNNYGGFEQFAEYISFGLAEKGHELIVYNPHTYKVSDKLHSNITIKNKWCPESVLKAGAHFIYDYLCLKDAIENEYDIIYQAGYIPSIVPYKFLRKRKKQSLIVTNMDGIEWKRTKWPTFIRSLMFKMENMAIKYSDELVADNLGIKEYIESKYDKPAKFLAYGANLVHDFNNSLIEKLELKPFEYYLVIARLERENNIEMICDGFAQANINEPLIVLGNHETKFGKYLQKRYQNDNIRFVGTFYDIKFLDALRRNCKAYFHGHSVGGTNPSLLEAMASNTLIISHNNQFNKSVLKNNGQYFSSSQEVSLILQENTFEDQSERNRLIEENRKTLLEEYSWSKIVDSYEDWFQKLLT